MNLVFYILQFFEYTSRSEIRFNSEKEMCMTAVDRDDTVTMLDCRSDEREPPTSQVWHYADVSFIAIEMKCSRLERHNTKGLGSYFTVVCGFEYHLHF